MSFPRSLSPKPVSLQKIWDQAAHNALPDLIRYRGDWYCTFRESNRHVYGTAGKIRLLQSHDGITWSSVALFEQSGVDLRDPKFSVTPSGQLMLLFGGTVYTGKNYESLQSRVSFSDDGKNWTPFQLILKPHAWLWRLTWHRGRAYGAAYSRSDPKDKYKPWYIHLYVSDNGLHFSEVTRWDIPGYPNETTVRFLKSGQMVALVRRDGRRDNHAWIGVSEPPYDKWDWKVTHQYFGGPNFLVLPNDSLVAAGRILVHSPYGILEKTVVGSMTLQDIAPQLILPSGGDCSYPGLVFEEPILWISYYSSHEGKAAIYLARVDLI